MTLGAYNLLAGRHGILCLLCCLIGQNGGVSCDFVRGCRCSASVLFALFVIVAGGVVRGVESVGDRGLFCLTVCFAL